MARSSADMPKAPLVAVPIGEDEFVVDAQTAADGLGLPVDVFWEELKRGLVFSVVERGEGEDAGRTRLTLRYRSKSWSVIRHHDAA
jgi:hypothetical protein